MDRNSWLTDTITHADHTHPVDLIEPEEVPEIDEVEVGKLQRHDPELITLLVRILLFPDTGRVSLRASWVRLVALAHALHIEGVGNRSLESLAKDIGCTRSLLSHYATALRDFGNLDCRAGKSLSAREKLSRAHTPDWNRRNRVNRERRGLDSVSGG